MIRSKITEIYKEKLKYFIDISKSTIISDMSEFMICPIQDQTINELNKTKVDIKLQHNMSIYEMSNIDYTIYNFFEIIEESKDFVELRKKIKANINEALLAINKLTGLKDGVNTSQSTKSIVNLQKNKPTTDDNPANKYNDLVDWKYTQHVVTGKIGGNDPVNPVPLRHKLITQTTAQHWYSDSDTDTPRSR